MKKKLIYILLLCIVLPLINASYFEVYQFKPEDCKANSENDLIDCTIKLYNKSSNLYFIETDEYLEDRIKAKPFLYEVGGKIWPSNPTFGAYIFLLLFCGVVYLIWKYKHKII